MKSYSEQKYNFELNVLVTQKDSKGRIVLQWKDAHKGLNAGHALFLAKKNWEGFRVQPLQGE